jgi:hypothetical protein
MIRKSSLAVVAALVLAIVPAFAQDMPSLPDSQKTPGDALKTVATAQIADCLSQKTGDNVSVGDPITLPLICTPGYTQCIRNVSTAVKRRVYASYGLQGNHTGYCDSEQGCEVDHLISLEIGGSNDSKNLWPQPFQGEDMNAHVKDQLENWLHAEVCAGRMPLKQAQDEISSNWIDSFNKHNLGSK